MSIYCEFFQDVYLLLMPTPLPHTHLVLLEVGAHSPPLVVGEGVPVLLEEGVDTRDTTIPRIFQVLQCQAAVLCIGLLALQSVLRPHTLAVNELTLPWLDIAVCVVV